MCKQPTFSSFQSEWSAAVLFLLNPALVCVSLQKQSLSTGCCKYLQILIFLYNPVLFLFDFARKTEFISSYMSISRMPCLS